MKILLVTTNLPYPITDGGRSRSYNILKGLSRFNEIDLVGFSSANNTAIAVTELSRYCRKVYPVPFAINNSIVKLIRSLWSKTPYKVLQYYCSEMTAKIKELVGIHTYDLILSEHIFVEQHIPKVSIPVIPQNIDLNYSVYQRIAAKGRGFMSLYSASQWRTLYRYEQQVLKKYNVGIALSSNEELLMKEMVKNIHTFLVPNGVDTSYFQPVQDISEKDQKNIIFTGSYSYFPNEQAAYYFATEIFPTISLKIPDVKFIIIGRAPSRRLLNLQSQKNIIVTNEVDDIRPYFAKAHVVVAPIQFGGGTRLKILEALASGKAVVTTSIGCEGIEVEDGKHLIIADEANMFADSVVSLLLDPQKAFLLGNEGRSVIEKKYSWESITSNFQTSLEQVIQQYPRSSERINENRN